MAGKNLTILIGNIGKEVSLRYTKSGKAVCNFSLAVQERKDEEVEWFNITAWDKLAEICQEYLSVGSQIYVEGRRKTEKWDKEGVAQYKENIIIYSMTMLGQANGGDHEAPPSSQGERGD